MGAQKICAVSKDSQMEMSKVTAAEPKKNQCKKQTAHLRLLLDMRWVFACDLEMKHQSLNGMPTCHQERKSCRSQNPSRKSC
jgi:hypothetical protein